MLGNDKMKLWKGYWPSVRFGISVDIHGAQNPTRSPKSNYLCEHKK